MPKIELAWYASFLKNMHGILFIAIILGNLVDWFIRYGLEQNRLDEFAGHGEYLEGGGPETGPVELNEEGKPETIIKDENKKLHKEYYEVTTLVKIFKLLHFILKVATSCFYMVAIVFITDRGIA